MELIGQGNTAEIYEYEDGKILKLFRTGISVYVADQEYYNSCIVYKALGNLVLQVYGKMEYDGRPGIIYERVVGNDMLKKMISQMFHLKSNAKEFTRYHISIQREISEEMMSVKEKLRFDLKRVTELNEGEKNKILKVLSGLPEGNKICHMDFHPGNIMFQNDKPIIIDWMTACVGDPLADVARTCMMLKYAEIPGVSGIVKWFIHFFKKRILRYYLKEYLQITGVAVENIEAWALPIYAARLSEWIPDKERKKMLSVIKKLLAKIT